MKKVLLSTGLLVITCFVFSSCGNSTAAGAATGAAGGSAAGGAATTDAVAGTATSGAADASFSYVIEGHAISGSGVGNGANVAARKAGGLVRFILMSLDTTQKAPPQFLFQVADHGTTTITQDDMERYRSDGGTDYADFSIPPLDPNNPIPQYHFGTSVAVTITAMSASRITGTFSGTMVNRSTRKTVPLTDGKFDLPVK